MVSRTIRDYGSSQVSQMLRNPLRSLATLIVRCKPGYLRVRRPEELRMD